MKVYTTERLHWPIGGARRMIEPVACGSLVSPFLPFRTTTFSHTVRQRAERGPLTGIRGKQARRDDH